MDLQTLLKKSEARLADIHPAIRELAVELIKRSHAEGINILITQGYRSIEYQNSLYAQGRTTKGNIVTNAKGGYSFHNFGLAFDFAVYAKNGKDINWTVNSEWKRVGAIGQSLFVTINGKKHYLEWGGAWKGFVDYPHFQLTFGLSTASLRAGMKPPFYAPIPVAQKSESEDDEPMKTAQWQKDLYINGINKYAKVKYGNGTVINSPKEWIEKVENETLTAGELATLAFTILTRIEK